MVSFTIPKVQSFTSNQLVPDILPFGYSSNYLYSFLNSIGEDGRNAYLLQLCIDIIYPFFLSLSIYLGLIRYYKEKISRYVRSLYYLTWSIMIFDYSENIMIFLQIVKFPTRLYFVGSLAPIFSLLKSMITTIVLTIAIVHLIHSLWTKKIHNKLS